MSAPAMGMTPLEYVDASKREREVGNHRKAAGLMWQATQATFIALADAHGVELGSVDEGDLIDLARGLEADGSVPKWRYRGGLAPGSLLKDHAEMGVLESYQLELAYETAEQFIKECLHEL